MPTLHHAMNEQQAIRGELSTLMQRLHANEHLINHLSSGGSPDSLPSSPGSPPQSRGIGGPPQGRGMGSQNGGQRGYGGGGGGRPQTAPAQPSPLAAAYASRGPPRAGTRPKKLTMSDLQAKREEYHAAVQAAPDVDHWAEPTDKPSTATLDQIEKTLVECFEKTREFKRNPDNPVQALQMLFNRLDPNHSGKLDRNEFTGMCRALGFDADPKVMNSLFNRYDFDRSNTINTAEFGKMLFKADGQSKAMSTIGRIRECLSLRAGGYATLKAMSMQFRIGDRDRSGQLSKEEFDIMLDILLNAFKVKLSPADKNNLFIFFDLDKSDGVSYDEFVREVRGPMNEDREHLVQQAFKILDKDGSGVVDARDLADTYDVSQNPAVRSGKQSPQDCLNKFMEALGGHNGQISFDDFLEHYQWMSSNIDSDDYFELMMRNAWHISGGQGWAANTSDLRVLVRHSNGQDEVVELQHDMGLPHDPQARYQEIVKRLQQQGVKDIKKVELASATEG